MRSSAATAALEPLINLDRVERWTLVFLALGWMAMFLPSYARLAETTWSTDEQGHGPIILAVSFWLLYRKVGDLQRLPARPAYGLGLSLLLFGCALYVIGHSQSIGVCRSFL